jgi:hypothetical protein
MVDGSFDDGIVFGDVSSRLLPGVPSYTSLAKFVNERQVCGGMPLR